MIPSASSAPGGGGGGDVCLQLVSDGRGGGRRPRQRGQHLRRGGRACSRWVTQEEEDKVRGFICPPALEYCVDSPDAIHDKHRYIFQSAFTPTHPYGNSGHRFKSECGALKRIHHTLFNFENK